MPVKRRRLSKAARARIVARQDGRCALSGAAFAAGDRIEFDHIVALALGGLDAESNIQAVLAARHKEKTRLDIKIIAKVNRIRKRLSGERRKRKPIPSRPFGPGRALPSTPFGKPRARKELRT